jgi:hypothetical protein
MVEELDPQVIEDQQQGEMFRQGVEPGPEPGPEPVVEAAPDPVDAEPELPPVEPDWLTAPAQPEPPPQQYQPDYNYQQPPQQQQYPQQPQVPQYGTPDAALQTFVDNPDGWADQKIEQRLAARDEQIRQQNQAIQNMTGMLMQDRMTEAVTGANAAVQRAYTVFNKDTSFRSNKDMQRSLQATLQGMRQKAEYEARTTGNFDALRTLSNLSESDMEATLAYMKVKAGTQSPGTGPLQVEGATVESSRSAVAGQTAELPEEFKEIANRLGPRGEARLLKHIQVTADADDFEG